MPLASSAGQNSELGREVRNIRALTVMILRVKEYSGAFAFAWERPEKPTCLSACQCLTLTTPCSGSWEHKKTNLEKNGKSENPGFLQSTLENTGGMILWPGVQRHPNPLQGMFSKKTWPGREKLCSS